MRGKNRHMSREQRFYIETELKKKTPVSVIAKALGYSRQAVYSEIAKGSFERLDGKTWEKQRVYAYDVGQRVHDEKMRRDRKKKLDPDDAGLRQILNLIRKERYSPEAARIKTNYRGCCTKTLYNYVHSGHVGLNATDLPYAKKHRKKRESRAKTMPKGTSIEQRPAFVNDRNVFGHWEMDTVYSSNDDKTCLLVLSERMTRYELLFKIKDRTAASVISALDAYERKIGSPAFRKTFLSVTCDNGSEFSDWEAIGRSCRTKGQRTEVYFCHPYCSWERGTNENINRMVRRWIPKGDDIGLYSTHEIMEIQDWINDYPREIFGGLSARICRESMHTAEKTAQKNGA